MTRMPRVRAWRWWPLVGYAWLVVLIVGMFAWQTAHNRRVCLDAAAERQTLYELLTLRPIPEGTPPPIRAKLVHAQQVFSRPADCGELL